MLRTIYWENEAVVLIDQRALPVAMGAALPVLICRDYREVVAAIRTLAVRGAPAIGVAAALGIALGIRQIIAVSGSSCSFVLGSGSSFAPAAGATPFDVSGSRERLKAMFENICADFAAARPTAVNLFWAIAKMQRAYAELLAVAASLNEKQNGLLQSALNLLDADIKTNRRLGNNGQVLIAAGDSILTHCNAGALACAGYGTALGVLRAAQEAGKTFSVYASETRPVLQGARLIAWELQYEGIATTLICDNMAGALMAAGRINKVITGADRIARNGDTANKIGTYSLAVLARAHGIPFYVAAPFSTFDLSIDDGAAIPIEERDGNEITHIGGRCIAPVGIAVYNPAFDITPAALITVIVTERGVLRAPYLKTIAALAPGANRYEP